MNLAIIKEEELRLEN